jgi:hypothetical protein
LDIPLEIRYGRTYIGCKRALKGRRPDPVDLAREIYRFKERI